MAPITYERKVGTPIQAGSVKITPVSQVLQISIPGMNGGLIWNRPTAVKIEDMEGQIQELPVQDATLQAIASLAIIGLVFGLVINFAFRAKRNN